MYLDRAEALDEIRVADTAPALPATARWHGFPHSEPSHHGEACCDIARHWVAAMDFAQLNGGDRLSGPRWLRERYEWGPSPWPIPFCELVARKTIDCGAHSALAHLAFEARGVTAFRAQFVQRYSQEAHSQWRTRWKAEKVSDHWLGDDDAIYHEGNAVLVGDDEIKLWDPSAGCWLNPKQMTGYGSLAAVRLFGADEKGGGHWGGGDGLRWGEHRIKPDAWHHFV